MKSVILVDALHVHASLQINAVTLHLVPDGYPGNPQNGGGLGLVAAGLFKGFDEPLFF